MKITVWRVLLAILLLVVAFVAIGLARNWDMIRRTMLGGYHIYETVPPVVPTDLKRPAILVFSKTNGFRHKEAIPAANALFARIAAREGWGYYQTENGATFRPDILKRFDAVVLNSVSGDVFTPGQRQALRAFVEQGGGFVGVHGAGGDFKYDWPWYADALIGARFKGHPLSPQFQRATVHVEDATHPATRGLSTSWSRIDEWYSFKQSPRRPGYHILATLDEGSYAPGKMFGTPLTMGRDHPIAWWHCVGNGRVLYSAMGHQASAYSEPAYQRMLQGAVSWALRRDGTGCDPASPAAAK